MSLEEACTRTCKQVCEAKWGTSQAEIGESSSLCQRQGRCTAAGYQTAYPLRVKGRVGGNAVQLTVRGELVEPPAIHPEPFDKLRANGIYIM